MCQVKDNKIDVTALLPSILPHLSTQAIVQYSIVQYSTVQYSIASWPLSELPFHSEKTTDCKKQPVKLVALHLQQLQGQKLKTPGSPTTTFYGSIIKTQVEKKKCLIFKHLGHKKTIILAGFVTPMSMFPCLPLKESAYASPRVEAT